MGPPREAPKSLMMFWPFVAAKAGRAFSALVVFCSNKRPCRSFWPDFVIAVTLVTSPNSALFSTMLNFISAIDSTDGSAGEFCTPKAGELALMPSML